MSEHLLVFPDRDVAEQVAAELRDEGFTEVRVVREAMAGEDDSEAHEWAVHVVEEMVADESGPVEGGLRDRFQALVDEHGGWYDPEPDGWSSPPHVVAHRGEPAPAQEAAPA